MFCVNDTATTEIYTLSLHDALPISLGVVALIVLPFDYRNALMVSMAAIVICLSFVVITGFVGQVSLVQVALAGAARSEEHTSELQSRQYLVCRLLLEKQKLRLHNNQ